MSATNFGVGQTYGGNTTSDFDITDSGFLGAAPKGALVIVTQHISSEADSGIVDASIGIGFTDGTNQHALWASSEDAEPSVDSYSRVMSDKLAVIHDPPTGYRDGWRIVDATTPFPTDAVTIADSNTYAGAYQHTAMLFGGADISCEVGNFNPNATQNSTTVVTTTIKPHAVILFASGDAFETDTGPAESNANIHVGFFAWDESTFEQACASFCEVDGSAAGDPHAYVRDNRCLANFEGASQTYTLEVTAATTTSFTVTTRDAAGIAAHDICWMAIELASDAEAHVGVVSAPTTTQSKSYTSSDISSLSGRTPKAMIQLLTMVTALDTVASDGSAGVFGIAVNISDAQECHSIHCERTVTTTCR